MEPVHIEEAERELGLGEEVSEVVERRGLAHSVRAVEEDPELATRHGWEPIRTSASGRVVEEGAVSGAVPVGQMRRTFDTRWSRTSVPADVSGTCTTCRFSRDLSKVRRRDLQRHQ